MSEEKKITEIKEEPMEEKLSNSKLITKIIECVYMQELYQSVVSLDKMVCELSAEEYLKLSEMIRDDTTSYSPQLILQIVRCLKEPMYETYISYVMMNIYYYLHLYRHNDYVVCNDMIEELNNITNISGCVDHRIRDALINLIRENITTENRVKVFD
jgi:hypothetical protein